MWKPQYCTILALAMESLCIIKKLYTTTSDLIIGDGSCKFFSIIPLTAQEQMLMYVCIDSICHLMLSIYDQNFHRYSLSGWQRYSFRWNLIKCHKSNWNETISKPQQKFCTSPDQTSSSFINLILVLECHARLEAPGKEFTPSPNYKYF